MNEAEIVEALYRAYFEWLEKKPVLRGKLKSQFTRWVGTAHGHLFVPYRNEPAVFHQLCEQVKQGQALHASAGGLSFQVLSQYATRLLRYYNTLPEQTRAKTFALFFEQIRKGCTSQDELDAFLRR